MTGNPSKDPEAQQAPLFPDLSRADNQAILRYYEQYVATPQRPMMELWLLQHEITVYPASTGELVVGYGLEQPLAEGVVTFDDIVKIDRPVAQEINRAISTPQHLEQYTECLRAWKRRGGAIDERVEWKGILDIEAHGGKARVVRLEIPPEQWRPEFDEELKECVRALNEGREWLASKDYSYRFQTGGCVPPTRKEP